MSVLFEGQAKVMINRHRFMGDGISIHFPNCIVFANTSGKYSAQLGFDNLPLVGDSYETIADAYIAAQIARGTMIEKDGGYEFVERKGE